MSCIHQQPLKKLWQQVIVFASYPVTHEIVLRGYQNGQTQVYDPYNANNNGWYSVDYIFGSKSGAPEDNTEGSPFISVRA